MGLIKLAYTEESFEPQCQPGAFDLSKGMEQAENTNDKSIVSKIPLKLKLQQGIKKNGLIKSASTAMMRYAKNLSEDKIIPFATKLHGLMQQNKIPKKEMLIKSLGKGGLQKADLVIHPKFGPSVRKYHYRQGMNDNIREDYNDFFKYVSKKHPRSFPLFKGYEGSGRLQKDYFEYVPGREAKSDIHSPHYSTSNDNNYAKLSRNLRKDIMSLSDRRNINLSDLTTSNIKGNKLIDPMILDFGRSTYNRENLITLPDIKQMLSSHSY